jgi:hypothetical protein
MGTVQPVQLAAFKSCAESHGEQVMAANDKPLSRSEMSASISLCGLLFILAFSELGHLAWAVPAMILFSLAGLGLLSVLLSGCDDATAPVVP